MDMHNSDAFSSAFEFASGKIGARFQNPLWQITELFVGSAFQKAIREVRSFGTTIVANAVASRQVDMKRGSLEESSKGIAGSLIRSLLDSIDDHQLVADAALNYLSAGEHYLIKYIVVLTLNRKGHYSTSVNMDLLPSNASFSSDSCNTRGGYNECKSNEHSGISTIIHAIYNSSFL